MKWLMKLICPSGKTLAGYASGGIAKSVNASKEEAKTKVATGTVRIQGHIRGHINGMVDADINGILHGQINASVTTDNQLQEGGSDNV